MAVAVSVVFCVCGFCDWRGRALLDKRSNAFQPVVRNHTKGIRGACKFGGDISVMYYVGSFWVLCCGALLDKPELGANLVRLCGGALRGCTYVRLRLYVSCRLTQPKYHSKAWAMPWNKTLIAFALTAFSSERPPISMEKRMNAHMVSV